jgi:hypothetical protein
MRQALRLLGIGFWSLLSLDVLIGIVDYVARWEWLESLMRSHPHIAAFVRTPFVYAVLLIFGFVFLTAERKLNLPRIMARYTNSRIILNLKTTTMKQVIDSEEKKPGWDLSPVDWHWLVEVQLANESDTPTTIEEVEVSVKLRGKYKKLPIGRKAIAATYIRDLNAFDKLGGAAFTKLPSLLTEIDGKPLTKGIGHRGWMRIDFRANQHDVNNHPILDIRLVDALRGKHRVDYERNSDKHWDQSFEVHPSIK